MKLDQSFTVQADPDVVWKALTDPMRVAPNLPGAAITEDAGDGTFKGEFKVKIGPTTAAYNGAMKIEELDEERRVATLSARGTDKRGNGGATATIVSTVADAGGGSTRVDVATDFSITGKLARFGRGGMIQDVSNRLLREFAANLQADLAGPGGEDTPPPAPAAAAAATPGAPTPAGAGADAPDGTGTAAPDGGAAVPPPRPAPGGEAPRPPRPPAAPLDGGGLVAGVVADRLRGSLPAFLLGVIAGLLLAPGRR